MDKTLQSKKMIIRMDKKARLSYMLPIAVVLKIEIKNPKICWESPCFNYYPYHDL